MNQQTEQQAGVNAVIAAFGLAALPADAYKATVSAITQKADMAIIHDAAERIVTETSLQSLQAAIAALIFLANGSVSADEIGQTDDASAPVDEGVAHG